MTKSSVKGKKRSFEYAVPPKSYVLSGTKKAKRGEGPLFDLLNRRRFQTEASATGNVSTSSEDGLSLESVVEPSEVDSALEPHDDTSEENASLETLVEASEIEAAVEADGEPSENDGSNGKKKKNNIPWTAEEDAVIVQFVGKLAWKDIAAKLPLRSMSTVKHRWSTKLNPVAVRMVCCPRSHHLGQSLTRSSSKRMQIKLHHPTKQPIDSTLNLPIKLPSCR